MDYRTRLDGELASLVSGLSFGMLVVKIPRSEAWKGDFVKEGTWLIFDGLDMFHMMYVRYFDCCLRDKAEVTSKTQISSHDMAKGTWKRVATWHMGPVWFLLDFGPMVGLNMASELCLGHRLVGGRPGFVKANN